MRLAVRVLVAAAVAGRVPVRAAALGLGLAIVFGVPTALTGRIIMPAAVLSSGLVVPLFALLVAARTGRAAMLMARISIGPMVIARAVA